MGCEGGTERSRSTQQPTGATVGVMVAAVILLSAPVGRASTSHHHICPTHKSSVKLIPSETAFFTTSDLSIRIRVEAVGCVNDTRVVRLAELNETSQFMKNLKWYEFNFISCGNYVAKMGSKIVKFKHSSSKCSHRPITLYVEPPALLGWECLRLMRGRKELEESKSACKAIQGVPEMSRRPLTNPTPASMGNLFDLLKKQKNFDKSDLFFGSQQDSSGPDGNADSSKSLFDTPGLFFGGQQKPEVPEMDTSKTFLNWPKVNYEDFLPPTQPPYHIDSSSYFDNDTDFSKRRNYKENAIPIFIGTVVFTVSMCLRFCLCRGKSVVRRVTTVTVIRSRPAGPSDTPQDQQDPPPAYIDVVNEATLPQSTTDDACVELPPPAYADIEHETLPPTYSEVEAHAISTSEEAPLADQEVAAQTIQSPPDPESSAEDKGSAASRNVLSKYRSQQKQFAFKVLEEDE